MCKTPNCNTAIPLRYIGAHTGQPIHVLPDPMPGWFDFQCGDCGKVHRYMRGDLATLKVPDPPPPGFVDQIDLAARQKPNDWKN